MSLDWGTIYDPLGDLRKMYQLGESNTGRPMLVNQEGKIISMEDKDMKENEVVLKSTDTQYEMEEKLKPWLGRLTGDLYAFLVESLEATEEENEAEEDPLEKIASDYVSGKHVFIGYETAASTDSATWTTDNTTPTIDWSEYWDKYNKPLEKHD